MKRSFLVKLDVPEGCTLPEMAGYIENAVATWKGQLHPDEPLFDLDGDSVKVKSIPIPRQKKQKPLEETKNRGDGHVVVVEVHGPDPDSYTDIDVALINRWSAFQKNEASSLGIGVWTGEGYLNPRISEVHFAHLIRNTVWKANCSFCEIHIRIRIINSGDLPFQNAGVARFYFVSKESYEIWKESQPSSEAPE